MFFSSCRGILAQVFTVVNKSLHDCTACYHCSLLHTFWAENIRNEFNWPFGALLCRLVNGIIKANLFISVFLVVAISQDRYCVLVHPMASRRRRRRRRAQGTCLLIWAMGALLSLPTFLLRSIKAMPELNVSACVLQYPHDAWPFVRMVELTLLSFLLPLGAIVFFNCHMLWPTAGS